MKLKETVDISFLDCEIQQSTTPTSILKSRSSQSSQSKKERKIQDQNNDSDIENDCGAGIHDNKKFKIGKLIPIIQVDNNVSTQSQSSEEDEEPNPFNFKCIEDADTYETFIDDVKDYQFRNNIVKMLKSAPMDRRLRKWENCLITGMMLALFDQKYLLKSVRLAGSAPDGSTEVVLKRDMFPFELLNEASGLDSSQVNKSLENLFQHKTRKILSKVTPL